MQRQILVVCVQLYPGRSEVPALAFFIWGCLRVLSHLTGENLLQYNLIICSVYEKSTLVPVSPVPSAQLEMTFGTGLSLKNLLFAYFTVTNHTKTRIYIYAVSTHGTDFSGVAQTNMRPAFNTCNNILNLVYYRC